MKFDIKHKITGDVIFTTEVDCSSDAEYSLKLGLAVKAAVSLSADLSDADLRHADLSCADLRHADLSYADLSGANLRHADLSCADLRHADLSCADLSGAILSCADLRHADLSCADLRHADLSCADLRHADLHNADLRHADLRHADLSCADLWGTIGNMKEVKSMQIDTYSIVFTTCGTMQIGCKRYSVEEWKEFSDAEINEMDAAALNWWKKWKDFIFTAIEKSIA